MKFDVRKGQHWLWDGVDKGVQESKIDLMSKTPSKYKRDFNKNILSMKLTLVPPSDELVVIGEAIEE